VLELASEQRARVAVWPLVLRCRRRGQQVVRPVGIPLQTRDLFVLDRANATEFLTIPDWGFARRCMASFIVSTGWGSCCCRDESRRAGDAKPGDLRCGQDRQPTRVNTQTALTGVRSQRSATSPRNLSGHRITLSLIGVRVDLAWQVHSPGQVVFESRAKFEQLHPGVCIPCMFEASVPVLVR